MRHCVISSRLSANHNDSANHVTLRYNLPVSKKTLLASLRLTSVPQKLEQNRKERNAEIGYYCRPLKKTLLASLRRTSVPQNLKQNGKERNAEIGD